MNTSDRKTLSKCQLNECVHPSVKKWWIILRVMS